MWKTLRQLLPRKKQHSDAPISIKINDAVFSDLERITHAFNEFFVNVGSDSAQNASSYYSHAHFLRNKISSSMVLFSPSSQEVLFIYFYFSCMCILLSRESDQSAIRARLGVASHQSTTPRWGNPAKCFSQRHNK